jgi:5-methyltetrahydrofolate--homocysteine methyltransferase
MAQGLDAAIIDPTDRELMAGLVAAEAILDRDKFCSGYITAYRQGKLS